MLEKFKHELDGFSEAPISMTSESFQSCAEEIEELKLQQYLASS